MLVELIDLDDNLPEFIFPNPSTQNFTARFECPSDRSSANREFQVAQLDSIDRDADPEHAQIAYGLLSSNSYSDRMSRSDTVLRDLFRVDENTGKVFYRRPADCVIGTYELLLEAYNPNQLNGILGNATNRSAGRSESRLLVVVNVSKSSSHLQFASDGGTVSQRNANGVREAADVGGLGMSQLLVALAIGAVVVVIAILVLLVIVARLNHREDDRDLQRVRRRKTPDAALRRVQPELCKHDAEPDEDDPPSSACATPTYSSAHAHARLSGGRRDYVYHPVGNNNNHTHGMLVRRASSGSVCSACAAATLQRSLPPEDRYQVLVRMADQYEPQCDTSSCACPDCLLPHRVLPNARVPKNEFNCPRDELPERYATVNAALRREQTRLTSTLPLERVYVHQTVARPNDSLNSVSEHDKSMDGDHDRPAVRLLSDASAASDDADKSDDNGNCASSKPMTIARQPSDAHCAVSFV